MEDLPTTYAVPRRNLIKKIKTSNKEWITLAQAMISQLGATCKTSHWNQAEQLAQDRRSLSLKLNLLPNKTMAEAAMIASLVAAGTGRYSDRFSLYPRGRVAGK